MYLCRFGRAVCGPRTSNSGEHVESDDVVLSWARQRLQCIFGGAVGKRAMRIGNYIQFRWTEYYTEL